MNTANTAGPRNAASCWTRGLQTRAEWLRLLGVAAGCGLMLGVLGPFGSFLNGSYAVLLTHWMLGTVLAAALGGVIVPLLLRYCRACRLPWVLCLPVSLALFSVPVAVLVRLEAGWLWPTQTAHLHAWDWYGQVLFVSACVTGVWLLVHAGFPRHETAADRTAVQGSRVRPVSGADTRAPALIAAPGAGVPAPHPGADGTLCLQMEDHYVRIHHASGSQLELMSMQDAIIRFGRDGVQVHRSWWVAGRAVVAAEREGRNWRLRLSNGLAVPVARNRIAAVRALGWLAG